jgi:NADH:ubiquinone oxidoreductase subunit 6 (subunit J)
LKKLIETILLLSAIVLAFLTIELKNILHAVLCLGAMCIVIGVIFGFLNALYVMAFQLLTCAGAIMVLFISAIMLTKRKEE